MPTCIVCNSHYFTSPFNETNKCDSCLDVLDEDFIDEEYELEINQLKNPSGRVRPQIHDDQDEGFGL